MDRLFIDESGKLITEHDLYREYVELVKSDPETYDYSFSDYVRNCTGKNGSLELWTVDRMLCDISDELENQGESITKVNLMIASLIDFIKFYHLPDALTLSASVIDLVEILENAKNRNSRFAAFRKLYGI